MTTNFQKSPINQTGLLVLVTLVTTGLIHTSTTILAKSSTPANINSLVSISLCTDELALELSRPGQLRSVSYVSHDPYQSQYAKQASPILINHGRIEELIALKPDLVLHNQYSSRYTIAMLKKLNFKTLELPSSNSIKELYSNIKILATVLGTQKKGELLIQSIKHSIKSIENVNSQYYQKKTPSPTVLIYRLGGWLVKPPDLLDELIERAGGTNLARSMYPKQWNQVSLETIARLKPNYIIVSHSGRSSHSFSRYTLNHPIFNFYRNNNKLISIPSSWVNCGNPVLLKALKKIHIKLHSHYTH